MLISEAAIKYKVWREEHKYMSVISGFETIDMFFQGWSPGELCVVGGRPGMGKTTFVLSVIRHHVSQQIPTALITHDDVRNPVFLQRVLCAITDQESEKEYNKLQNTIEHIDASNIRFHIQSKAQLTMDYIQTEARRLAMEEGVRCIFIEDLQTIFASESCSVNDDRNDRICYSLRALARELLIPIIVTSELNRGPEHRDGIEGKRPCMSDLRATSAIENAADSVWLLYRPDYYHIAHDKNGNNLRNIVEIFIEKNRYGFTTIFMLHYDRKRHLMEIQHSEPKPPTHEESEADVPF